MILFPNRTKTARVIENMIMVKKFCSSYINCFNQSIGRIDVQLKTRIIPKFLVGKMYLINIICNLYIFNLLKITYKCMYWYKFRENTGMSAMKFMITTYHNFNILFLKYFWVKTFKQSFYNNLYLKFKKR